MKALKSMVPTARKSPSSQSNIPQPILPILCREYSRPEIYVLPRLVDVQNAKSMRLDRAAAEVNRAILIGPAGSGKSAALDFICPGCRVLSLADAHPGALPSPFPGSPILLDDAQVSKREYLSLLSGEYGTRIFVASQEWEGIPDDFQLLELQRLNEREISSIVEAWCPSPKPRSHETHQVTTRASDEVISAIKANERTRRLATNPLNLFLLMQVYTKGSPFPTRRTELFENYVQAVLRHYQSQGPTPGPNISPVSEPDFAMRALEGIALAIKRGEVAKPEHLTRGYGMLSETPSGRVRFAHPLLRDFLTARALRRNPDHAPMLEHMLEDDWREVLIFYAGLGESGGLVRALVDRDRIDLAAYVLAESPDTSSDLERRVSETLIKQAWDSQATSGLSALCALQSKSATDFFAGRLKERDPELRKRAAFILGELDAERAVEYLLPQLRDTHAGVRDQVVASLGKSTSDRVIEPLLVALRGDTRAGAVDTRMRVAAARALGEFGSERAVPALIVDLQVGEPEVRAEAVQALAKIGSKLAHRPLRAIVESNQSSDIRSAAQQALECM